MRTGTRLALNKLAGLLGGAQLVRAEVLMLRVQKLWIAVAVTIATTGTAAISAPVYHVTYLGYSFAGAFGPKLNNNGTFIAEDANHTPAGTIYTVDNYQILPSLSALNNTNPLGINDAGTVVGSSAVAGGVAHAFQFSKGTISDLGVLPGFSSSSAKSINNNGDIVGASSSGGGATFEAFEYKNGSLIDLGSGVANAINSSGTIVGTSQDTRAVMYRNGNVIDLGDFGDSRLTKAIDINDSGQIVGSGYVLQANGTTWSHPFIYQSGTWHDLGLPPGATLAIPSAINNAGQVVGITGTSSFLYTDGVIYDLSTLLDSSGTGIAYFTFAFDINDRGDILAQGAVAGFPSVGYEAVLLTPVPEPAALVLICCAVISVSLALLVRSRHGFSKPSPAEYRAGTSTEIYFRFFDSPRPGSWTVAVNNSGCM